MQISERGLNLIKEFEGCLLAVYLDPVGIKTVGVGHTGADVNALAVGHKITQAQADAWLRSDVKKAEANVAGFDHIYHWTQAQYDALVSFAFNVGSIDQLTAKGTRTIKQISAKITAYNKAGGKALAGLTRRRNAEKAMFDESTAQDTPKTTQNGDLYTVGKTYTTQANIYVREQPDGKNKAFTALTASGRAHGYAVNGNAVLRTGTKVTCKATKTIGADVWMQIPSGWIAGLHKGQVLVK